MNEAGRFIFCSVCDLGLKEFNIIVPEGKGLFVGGVVVHSGREIKGAWSGAAWRCEVSILEAQLREKGVVLGSFLEAAKPKPTRSGDSVWFEVGASEIQRRMEKLNWCLVG